MERDAWFFIGIFVFIFLIWIAAGGPLRRPSINVPTPPVISSSGSLTAGSGGSTIQLPRSPYTVGSGATVCLIGSTDCTSIYGNPNAAAPGTTDNIPVASGVTGVFLTPPSAYRNVVSMRSYVTNASSSDPKTEYVQISVAQNATAAVDITKWVLASGATGKAEIIPKGTLVPTSGVVNATDDIILQRGDSAYIISGESPVGASFRENKCIGYFGSFQQFTPSLQENCPSASDELSTAYGTPYIHDVSCLDYAKTLSRCQTALTPQSANLSLTCQDFLENRINYNGCLSNHRADSDFNGTTWYIYLGRKSIQDASRINRFQTTDAGPLWRSKYEVVELFDSNGKTVASFNY